MIAILIKAVSFVDFQGRGQFFKSGTEIVVDVTNGVAYANGVHFYIKPDEFNILH